MFLKLDIAKVFDTARWGLFTGGAATAGFWGALENLGHHFAWESIVNSAT